jgi:hypothetical protein
MTVFAVRPLSAPHQWPGPDGAYASPAQRLVWAGLIVVVPVLIALVAVGIGRMTAAPPVSGARPDTGDDPARFAEPPGWSPPPGWVIRGPGGVPEPPAAPARSRRPRLNSAGPVRRGAG